MATSVSDVFPEADMAGLPADRWQLIYGMTEIVDHAVVVSAASPAFAQAIALHLTPIDSEEQMVRARVALHGDYDPGDGIQLYARAETIEVGGEAVIDKAYFLQLTETRVAIYRFTTSSITPSCTAEAEVELEDRGSHSVAMKVREEEGGARIDVFIDNDHCPVLTFHDTSTKRPGGNLVGFGLLDATHHQDVSLTEFSAYTLRSAVLKPIRPPVKLLSFGDLVYQVQYRLDRAGNSQFPDEIAQDFVNFAIDEIYNEITTWKWAFRWSDFVAPANTQFVELPPYVALLYDVVNGTLGYQMSVVKQQDITRSDPNRRAGGGPYKLAVTGHGDFGGLVAELSPIPTSAVVLGYQYYARPVPLVDATDVPLIPTQWLEAVVYGALKRGFQYDTDQNAFKNCVYAWERMIAKMRRQNNVEMKFIPRLRTGNDLMREKMVPVSGIVTRAQQLGV